MGYAFAAMMGTCGTLWPGWWRHPDPDPDPWWWIVRIVGALGGIAASRYFAPMAGMDGVVAAGLVSFFGGTFAGSVVEGVKGLAGGKRTAN